jgi:predicted nuclease of restriction endonuclease-like (RecB) superfamily
VRILETRKEDSTMDRVPSNQDEYRRFLAELRRRIGNARITTSRSVNSELVLLYWDIGRGIMERQERLGWGESVVEMLSRDLLRAFPGVRGFSARNLWDMRRFYETYGRGPILQQAVAELRKASLTKKIRDLPRPTCEFLRQAVAEIPWGHHRIDAAERRILLIRGGRVIKSESEPDTIQSKECVHRRRKNV